MKNILRANLIITGFFVFLTMAPFSVMAATKTVSLVTYYPPQAGAYQFLRSDHACVGDDCAATVVDVNDFRVKGDVDATSLSSTALVKGDTLKAANVSADNVKINGPLAAASAVVIREVSANSMTVSDGNIVATDGTVESDIIKPSAGLIVPLNANVSNAQKNIQGSLWID